METVDLKTLFKELIKSRGPKKVVKARLKKIETLDKNKK
jgi:hypothetical protein